MNPPATILRKYYFFDIQNPNEFLLGKEKPILVERGPFTYRVIVKPQSVSFTGTDYMSFTPVSTFFFDSNHSNGTENDRIVSFLNIPAVVSY